MAKEEKGIFVTHHESLPTHLHGGRHLDLLQWVSQGLHRALKQRPRCFLVDERNASLEAIIDKSKALQYYSPSTNWLQAVLAR